VPIVLKAANLKLLETSGPVQACNGIALPFNMGGLKFAISGRELCGHFLCSKATVNVNQPEEIKPLTGSQKPH